MMLEKVWKYCVLQVSLIHYFSFVKSFDDFIIIILI